MALQISISNAIGARAVAGGGGVDPDAQAFITAAAITNPTQQSAINQLVVDLKGYSIWTKMKALYPFCGGSASSHKFNLKDPRDLDAAFRLVFYGGITHNSNGIQGNGTNGYFDTFITLGTDILKDANASGIYIRTNVSEDNTDYGVFPPDNQGHQLAARLVSNNLLTRNSSGTINSISNTDSRGFFQMTRRNSSNYIVTKNTTKTTVSISSSPSALQNYKSFGLCLNLFGSAVGYSTKQIAFHYYANTSLSDTELDNLYTAVQAFQTTLGRSIGTQTVSDADAQAFVTNAGIVDQVEANAINNLVIGLKADSLWTKMKAIYPFVGGTATTNKFNLVNPLDTDAAFRLVFNGGWTHSANGATPNGTNAYADTKFNDSTHFTSNTNGHISAYIRTDFPVAGNFETIIGCSTDNNGTRILTRRGTGLDYLTLTDNFSAQAAGNYSDKLKGQYLLTKDGTNKRYFKNSTLLHTAANGTNGAANRNIYLGAENYPVVTYYSNRELAFATIGDNLTNTDSTNFYNRVQTFNTALNRNV